MAVGIEGDRARGGLAGAREVDQPLRDVRRERGWGRTIRHRASACERWAARILPDARRGDDRGHNPKRSNLAILGAFMRIVDLIIRKRDGGRLSRDEIDAVNRWCDHRRDSRLPDLCAADGDLPARPRRRGDRLADRRDGPIGRPSRSVSLSGVKVGKHSTGGVGDKTSLDGGAAGRGVRRARAQELRPGARDTPAARSTNSSQFLDSGSA